MRKGICLVILLAMVCVLVNSASAVDQTSTGFYYPIGESNFDPKCGRWLNGDDDHKSSDQTCPYYIGLYHIGVDMMTYETDRTKENSRVYSIATGKVIYIHQSSDWGTTGGVNNVMVFIQHKTSTGIDFIGYYGHLQAQLADGVAKDKTVTPGQVIGYTGYYDGGIHLHFGIRKGTSTSPSPWGRMPNSSWTNPCDGNKSCTNDFVDPIAFIKNNSPAASVPTLPYRVVGNVAWYPPDSSCFYAERWIYFTSGFPNGGQSIGTNQVCQDHEQELIDALGGIFSNWMAIVYGYGSLNDITECKLPY